MRHPRLHAVLRRTRLLVPVEVAFVAALAVLVEVWLRLGSLPRLAAFLGISLAQQEQPTGPPPELPRWARARLAAVDRVMRRWPAGPPGKCLRSSLLVGQRLRALEPQLVLGVRTSRGVVSAHAWVVVRGGSLDPGAAQYAQLL